MAVAPRPSGSPGPGRSFAPRSCAVRTVTRLGCRAAADAWACTECTVRAVRGPAASGAAEAGPTSATARPRAAATLTAIRDSTVREVREVMFAHLRVQHGLGRAGGEWPKCAIVAARAVRTGCPMWAATSSSGPGHACGPRSDAGRRNGTWARVLTVLDQAAPGAESPGEASASMVVIDTHLARGGSTGRNRAARAGARGSGRHRGRGPGAGRVSTGSTCGHSGARTGWPQSGK